MNILVVGRAKSGTTAISRAIAAALPRCRFEMEPKDADFVHRRPQGFAGRCLPWRRPRHLVTKIIFDHWRPQPEALSALMTGRTGIRWTKVVLILRDPRDEMISGLHYWLYQHLMRHPQEDPDRIDRWISLMQDKERRPSEVSTLSLIQAYDQLFRRHGKPRLAFPFTAGEYRRFLASWPEDHHLLRYEDFVAGRWQGLENYLGFAPRQDHDGPEARRVARTRGAGQWKRFFTAEDLDLYRRQHGRRLHAMGYEDWVLEPAEALDPEHHSGYLRRLVAEAARDSQQQARA